MTTDLALRKQLLRGYGLTTATVIYRLPDFRSILQTFVWQTYDLHPEFPELQGFIRFWMKELEGPIHKIYVAHQCLITPAEIRMVGTEIQLH